jgi:hypothetical protein
MNKCIGSGNGAKCDAVATAKIRGSKALNLCVPCLQKRGADKIAADMIYAATQRASMAAFKAGR